MQLKIRHVTEYTFDGDHGYALQQLRVRPKNRNNQTVVDWQVYVEGGTAQVQFIDHHNNPVDLISVGADVEATRIISEGTVHTEETHGVVGHVRGYAPLWLYRRQTAMTRPGENLGNFLTQIRAGEPSSGLDLLHQLIALIAEHVSYEVGETVSTTTAEQAWSERHGVCQDHTHIFCSLARELGFPARYVSGFLMMNDRVDQEATHAWAEVFIDDLGWVGFDVSNRISPDQRYVCVATGLDYKEAAPVSGMNFGIATGTPVVSVQVQQ